MKSFNMLQSAPLAGETGEIRYFIDGARVTQEEYRKLVDNCARQDTFHSYRFAGRAHSRCVCYR